MRERLKKLIDEIASKLNSNPRYREVFKGWDIVAQVETDEGSRIYIHVSENGLRIGKGIHSSPNLVLRASEEVLEKILGGEMSEVKAFFTGRIRVRGDLVLAERLYRKIKSLLS